MAKQKQTSEEVNEYRHKPTGDTLSGYVGSELDKVLAKDPDYEVVGDHTVPPELTTGDGDPPTPQSGKTKSDGGRREAADLEGLKRDELNEIALEEGVENPEGFANIKEVKTAILEASPGADTTTEEG